MATLKTRNAHIGFKMQSWARLLSLSSIGGTQISHQFSKIRLLLPVDQIDRLFWAMDTCFSQLPDSTPDNRYTAACYRPFSLQTRLAIPTEIL